MGLMASGGPFNDGRNFSGAAFRSQLTLVHLKRRVLGQMKHQSEGFSVLPYDMAVSSTQ